MIRTAVDRDEFAIVTINSGPSTCDADFGPSEELVIEMTDLANRAGATLTLLIVVDAESQHPNAMRRKRMADVAKRMRASRTMLVTDSSVVRGIARVMEWLNPPRPGRVTMMFATLPEAIQWAEKDAGRAMPCLLALYRQARKAPQDGWKSEAAIRSARSA
jgi:hypothetical protein